MVNKMLSLEKKAGDEGKCLPQWLCGDGLMQWRNCEGNGYSLLYLPGGATNFMKTLMC
jgi:hypothetical protein